MDPEEVRRRWRLGEERLYPVVMVRPELYATCLDLVGVLKERLQTVPDPDALMVSYQAVDARRDLLDAGVDLDGLPPDLDVDMLRDAAYQVRARELEARRATEGTELAIRRARQAGAPTVEIWAHGERESMLGYRRVEMSLATGRAVAMATEMDAESGEPRYTLEALQLDPASGEDSGAGPLGPRQEFDALDAWRAAAERLRAETLQD